MFSYIRQFGFGKKTGIDLNGEGEGILFPLSKVGPVELATTAFGQGVSVTPIQQITAVSAAINGGTLYQPYVVKGMLEPVTNTVVKETQPKKVDSVISKETSKEVRFALENVVSNGSGRNAYVDGYRVGGKTGTAQKVKNGAYMVGNYILSFVGFLPADDPEVVIYVAIDNPKGVVQYGGTVAAPIARNVILDCIEALDIKKRDGGIPKGYKYGDKKYVSIPNVVGMKVEDAVEALEGLDVEFTGKGDTVLEQTPKEGDNILEGSTVRLLVGNKK